MEQQTLLAMVFTRCFSSEPLPATHSACGLTWSAAPRELAPGPESGSRLGLGKVAKPRQFFSGNRGGAKSSAMGSCRRL